MNPNVLGVVGPGFLNQVSTLTQTRCEDSPYLRHRAVKVAVWLSDARLYPETPT